MVKNLPAMQAIQVQSLGWEDPLEKEIAAHSSILDWRIPWTESLAGCSSWGCRVWHDWAKSTDTDFIKNRKISRNPHRKVCWVCINQHMCTVQPQKIAPGKEQLPETIKQKSVLRSHRIKNHSSFRQPAWKGLLDIRSLQHRHSKDLPYWG